MDALAGRPSDPLKLIFARRIRLQGDLQRLVRSAGKHFGLGVEALRAVSTRF